MALGNWSAWATWLAYEFFGSRYDVHHLRGMGVVHFAAICTANLADREPIDFPERDIVYTGIDLSLILMPGMLWGLAF